MLYNVIKDFISFIDLICNSKDFSYRFKVVLWGVSSVVKEDFLKDFMIGYSDGLFVMIVIFLKDSCLLIFIERDLIAKDFIQDVNQNDFSSKDFGLSLILSDSIGFLLFKDLFFDFQKNKKRGRMRGFA